MSPARRLLAAAAALLALGGCGGDEAVTVLTCPQVYVVADASRLIEYAPGDGRDLIDKRFEAEIEQVEWLCSFFTEENRVETEVRFALRAEMGPAAQQRQARFPYFVVVTAPSGEVLAKQVFAIDIAFPGNARMIRHIESVFQTLSYGSLAEASRYTVYIGFQLTPEQLAEARAGVGF